MDKNLKSLFGAGGPTDNDPKEEIYDSYNDETFGDSLETWEDPGDLFDGENPLPEPTLSEVEDIIDTAIVPETKRSPEPTAMNAPRRVGLDEAESQEKDNMLYLIDSTLSHLGLNLPCSKQSSESKKAPGNIRKPAELGEELCVELEQSIDTADRPEWTIPKQKFEAISKPTKAVMRPDSGPEDGAVRRESFHQMAMERGDADRVVIGALMSPRRGSGRAESTRFDRDKNSGYFLRRFSGQNANLPTAGSLLRPENFDLRNAETFGMDAVQKHGTDHVPGSAGSLEGSSGGRQGGGAVGGQPLVPASASKARSCVRHEEDNGNYGGFSNDRSANSRIRLPEIRDPRMYDFYVELWQKMKQEEELNNKNNHGATGGDGIGACKGAPVHEAPRQNCVLGQRRASDHRLGDPQFESHMAEMKHKVWEQLELVADLGPFIAVMEDVVDRLIDPTDPPSAEDRRKLLRKLSESISPDNVCNLVRLVHSRRLLMFSLAHLWSEPSFRDHVLDIVGTMLRRLDTLLVSDGSDMVFGQKRNVFTNIFSGCNMEQLTTLTVCLLRAPALAVESKLGLFFIGRILECADDADTSCSHPTWHEKCLPKITQHVARVHRADLVQELVGSRALNHIIRNMDSVGIMRAVREASAQTGNNTSY